MSIIKRFAVRKHLRNLENAQTIDEATLEESKQRLIEAGKGVLPALFDLLTDIDSRPVVQDVLTRLLNDDTLPRFFDVLGDSRRAVGMAVAETLEKSRGFDAVRLFDALSMSSAIRAAIEPVLLHRANDFPTAFLVQKLIEAESGSRKVLYRIVELKADRDASCLLPLLSHSDWWMRVHGLKLLAGCGDDRGVMARIRPLIEDGNRYVRLESVETLGRMRDRESVPILCSALRDRDLKIHTAAIDALIAIGDPAAVPHLIHVLADESEYTRRGAVEVLNEVATPEAIEDLVRALHDEDWWVRVRAADALGTLGGDRVVDAVLDLTRSEDVFIRRYAVEILNAIPNQKSVGHLIETLNDPDWWVRERSIDALGSTGDDRAVEPLLVMLQRDSQAAPLCARALGKMGDGRAVEPLMALASTPDDSLRNSAVAALEDLVQSDLPLKTRTAIREYLVSPNSASVRPGPQTGGAAAVLPAQPVPGLESAKMDWSSKPLDDVPRNQRDSLVDDSSSSGVRPNPVSSPGSPGSVTPEDTHIGAYPSGGGVPSGPPANSYSDLEPGSTLLGRYRVLRRIGSGGFGSVYLVADGSVGEEVILKILYPHISMDQTMIQRFVQELKYNRRIVHPNVIRLYDFVELEYGHAISMEYFPGGDLSSLLASGRTLSITEVLHIVCQICRGLGAAHSQSIVHRDIKPANILVGTDLDVKICDFGLASMADSGNSRLTKSGILIGTPHYMAPEQINGCEIDTRVDIYSVGIMLFEMLAGHPPYQGENPVNILFQHLQGDIPILAESRSDLALGISEMVRQAMDRDPRERPQSAEQFLTMISDLAA